MARVVLQTLTAALAVGLAACGQPATDSRAPEPASPQTVNQAVNDGWITTKIQAQFFADPNVKARAINVDTSKGVVTLTGTVENAASRHRALEIAQGTDGVRRVEDRLLIGRATGEARGTAGRDMWVRASNGWITTKIQAQYYLDRGLKGRNIEVETANGTVSLTGSVENERARQRAVEIARTTEGVRRIEDRLQITGGAVGTGGQTPAGRDQERPVIGAVTDAGITMTIQSKYFLDEDVKGRNIDVDTASGIVTLTGTVESEGERQQALAIARGTNGVRGVVDQLKIVPPAPSAGAGPRTGRQPTPREFGPAVNDAWIATKIQSKYFIDPQVKGLDITVTSKEGIVTLKGEVSNHQAHARAIELARDTNGVKNVIDQLRVTGS